MQFRTLLAAMALAVAPASAASGQTDLAARIINDPGAPQVNGAKAKLVKDSAVQGGNALRVTVPRKGQNNWDSVVESDIGKPVTAGDRLLITFQVRD